MSETAPEVAGPDAPPRDGYWMLLGYVGVDTGLIAICDPSYVTPTYQPPTAMFDAHELSALYGQARMGVQFGSGFGDGSYGVWGWVTDCGASFGERIAQVVITTIVSSESDETGDGNT